MSFLPRFRPAITTAAKQSTSSAAPRTFSHTAAAMGVSKTIIKEGTGPSPKKGDTISMHYTGWLKTPSGEKGEKFDSSLNPGRGVFTVPIGVGSLIQGWDVGVPQMKLGEKALLDITSDFGYGAAGTPGGPIPPNANLLFEVELLKIN